MIITEVNSDQSSIVVEWVIIVPARYMSDFGFFLHINTG